MTTTNTSISKSIKMKHVFQLLISLSLFSCGRTVVVPLPIPIPKIAVLPSLHPHFSTLDCGENGAIVLLEIGKLDSVPIHWLPISYDIYYKKAADSTYSYIAYNFEDVFKDPIMMYADQFKLEISFKNVVTNETKQSKYTLDGQDFEYSVACDSDKPLSLRVRYDPNLHAKFKKQSKYRKRISRSIAKSKAKK